MTTIPSPPDIADDPAARALLQVATERNYHWPESVGGFAATLTLRDGDQLLVGHCDAPAPRELQLDMPEATPDQLRWLQTEIGSLVGHRLARSFAAGDGRYRITAEPETAHPLGRLVRLHGDPNQSSYRIADGMLREANRTAGPRHFTLSVHSVQLVGDGQYLSQHYSVLHFANDSGRLIRADVYTDDYSVVDGVWLPQLRRLVSASDGELRTRELHFSAHQLRAAPGAQLHPTDYDQLRAKRDGSGV